MRSSTLKWQDMTAVQLTVTLGMITVAQAPNERLELWSSSCEQDRDHKGVRTPRWRGVTALQELAAAGLAVALASDNTRDQFYAYGDLDMLEVFTQVHATWQPYGSVVESVSLPAAGSLCHC